MLVTSITYKYCQKGTPAVTAREKQSKAKKREGGNVMGSELLGGGVQQRGVLSIVQSFVFVVGGGGVRATVGRQF
jgi:hypothetical protein